MTFSSILHTSTKDLEQRGRRRRCTGELLQLPRSVTPAPPGPSPPAVALPLVPAAPPPCHPSESSCSISCALAAAAALRTDSDRSELWQQRPKSRHVGRACWDASRRCLALAPAPRARSERRRPLLCDASCRGMYAADRAFAAVSAPYAARGALGALCDAFSGRLCRSNEATRACCAVAVREGQRVRPHVPWRRELERALRLVEEDLDVVARPVPLFRLGRHGLEHVGRGGADGC
mmetsp:Transcript_20264/g.64741  ORF Transcript_20264/g.64741 Transcript_20264/m.64741 type:complete len:235 (-) Transcript_20264:1849-2553(-)